MEEFLLKIREAEIRAEEIIVKAHKKNEQDLFEVEESGKRRIEEARADAEMKKGRILEEAKAQAQKELEKHRTSGSELPRISMEDIEVRMQKALQFCLDRMRCIHD